MEPDLQQISIRTALRRVSTPVNDKDAGTLSEELKIECRALRNVHMESLPQNYRVSARKRVSVIRNVASCSLIRRRRGMEHGQGAMGGLCCWVCRSRLMFRT